MPRTYAPVELNKFIAGFVTEASPLTFPENSSLDEDNFILKQDGSRERRLGIDYEDSAVIVDSGVPFVADGSIKLNSYKWKNVGGDATKTVVVVQVGNVIQFFDNSLNDTLSSGSLFQHTYPYPISRKISFASVDGLLVAVTGGKDVSIFTYADSLITVLTRRLKIRDFFGVTDLAT